MNFINALSIPIMYLNMFGGVVAGIWLLILGKWEAVGIAVASAFISSFTIGLAMMPGMLLSVPGVSMIKKGSGIFGHFLLFCSSIYIFGVLWYWSIYVFGIFASYIGPKGTGTFPLLLMAYTVATAPVGYMANKESDSPSTMITTFFIMLGCALFMIMLMFGIYPGTANLIFMGIMAIGIFVQLVVGIQLATAIRIEQEQRDFDNY